jgi:translation elongation factor EF-Ts
MLHQTKEQFLNLKNALTEYFGDEVQSKTVMKKLGIDKTSKKNK